MKIKDIISETASAKHAGKITARQQQATVGLNTFRDSAYADRVYELNRVMMAAACVDGINSPSPTVDSESWVGRNNVAAPYTKQEQDKLKQAYKMIGSHYNDINKGDTNSQELTSTNKLSPVAKPKKNKYGV